MGAQTQTLLVIQKILSANPNMQGIEFCAELESATPSLSTIGWLVENGETALLGKRPGVSLTYGARFVVFVKNHKNRAKPCSEPCSHWASQSSPSITSARAFEAYGE